MSKSIPGNHKHMTQDNRLTIEKGLDTGTSLRKIAESIGKDPSTVYCQAEIPESPNHPTLTA